MPQFLIERNFAEQLEVTKGAASAIKEVNDELSLRWVFSFLSADKKKTYCLYEAPSAEAISELTSSCSAKFRSIRKRGTVGSRLELGSSPSHKCN